MKKVTLLLLFVAASLFASAATSVSGIFASAHWTMGGSPYNVYNNLQVPSGDTLLIDPGVQVVFHGHYDLTIYGSLIAVGTPNMRIAFRINDTTGWHDPMSVYGGWKGINFGNITAPWHPDTIVMQYCDVSDMKIDGIGVHSKALVGHSRFFHNHYVIRHWPNVTDSVAYLELDSCEIFDNHGDQIINSMWCQEYIHDCSIHDNSSYYCQSHHQDTKLTFENNNVYNNYGEEWGIMLFYYPGSDTINTIVRIKGNTMHHNVTNSVGPIYVRRGGRFEITHNRICNNVQNMASSTCPFVQGGGALKVDLGKFLIRNNIIANNASIVYGGGIQINSARVYIYNNLFINNTAAAGGAISITDPGSGASRVNIRNNIFKGNEQSGSAPADYAISGNCLGSVNIGNNWLDNVYSSTVSMSGTVTGDTATNIIGTDPMLAAPTTIASTTDDATTADFTTLTTSPCYNRGTLVNVQTDLTDYAGNTRIRADTIDIGPYEIQVGSTGTTGISPYASSAQVKAWPNPVSGMLHVATASPGAHISLYDISGRPICSINATAPTSTIDMSPLSTGIYLLQVKMADGHTYTEKVTVR